MPLPNGLPYVSERMLSDLTGGAQWPSIEKDGVDQVRGFIHFIQKAVAKVIPDLEMRSLLAGFWPDDFDRLRNELQDYDCRNRTGPYKGR